MPSRKLSDLNPKFFPLAEAILAAAKARGITLLVTCTLRTNKEQSELYSRGRTKPGPKVTNCPAGRSAHNHGLALDVVPLIAGKPVWNASHPHWRAYGECVREAGAVWGGDFRSLKDLPHCEYPQWKTLCGK
jgi:peptidoglycan LD-endopeptidase CwlK